MANLEKHYHSLLGLTEGWKVTSVDLSLENSRVEIAVEWTGPRVVSCPECGEAVPLYDLCKERQWRHLDVMQFETILKGRVPRCQCPEHGVKTVQTPWAGKNSRFTLMYEAFAILVLQSCDNITAAGKILKLSWHQMNEIRQRAVERGLERREAEPIDYLGIDEKSFGKGQDYGTLLIDIDRSRVLEVIHERREADAKTLLQTLTPEQRESVLAVAADMWVPFMNAVEEVLPQAKLVHDKFHVKKKLNEAVDEVRKREHTELMKKKIRTLVSSKYLFLKNQENLTDKARERFEELRDCGLKVSRAWAIKNMFEEFWTFEFIQDAEAFFKDWYGWARRSRLEPIKSIAKTLKDHWEGLINYIYHPITNSKAEGFNSKVQVIKSSARGYRNFKNYRTAILFYCGKLDMLPARIPFPQKT